MLIITKISARFILALMIVGFFSFNTIPVVIDELEGSVVTVNSYAPQTPVFTNKDFNPLIRLAVHVPKEKGNSEFTSVHVKLNEVAVNEFEYLEVFVTGAGPFDPNKSLGKFKQLSLDMKLAINVNFEPGMYFVWISAKVKNGASLDKKVEVHALRLADSMGNVIAIKETGGFYSKRIAVGLRLPGQDMVHTYRIPGIAKTTKGTLLSVYDIRYKNSGDLPGNIDVGMSRSINGGRSWEPMKVIIDMGAPHENNGVGDPSILVDPESGIIWVAALWSKGNRSISGSLTGISPDSTGQLVLVKSEDDGLTWTAPVSITPQTKNPDWHVFFNGPGAGITMSNGNLVFPAQYWDEKNIPWSTIIYSVDHGVSWKGKVKGPKMNTTESQVVEIYPGTLMLNMRDNRGRYRSVAITEDMGQTWNEHPTSFTSLPDPVCMGSIMKANIKFGNKLKEVLFFSNPNSFSGRSNITIKASMDLGESWPLLKQLLIDENISYGYSCLVQLDDRTIGLLYEGIGSLYFLRLPVSEILN